MSCPVYLSLSLCFFLFMASTKQHKEIKNTKPCAEHRGENNSCTYDIFRNIDYHLWCKRNAINLIENTWNSQCRFDISTKSPFHTSILCCWVLFPYGYDWNIFWWHSIFVLEMSTLFKIIEMDKFDFHGDRITKWIHFHCWDFKPDDVMTVECLFSFIVYQKRLSI